MGRIIQPGFDMSCKQFGVESALVFEVGTTAKDYAKFVDSRLYKKFQEDSWPLVKKGVDKQVIIDKLRPKWLPKIKRLLKRKTK